MTLINYYKKWFDAENRPLSPIDEDEARRRHLSGDPYIAVIDQPRRCVVDLAGDWVSVLFLDERDRMYVVYDFFRQENDPETVFLNCVRYLTYDGDNDDETENYCAAFKLDGRMFLTKARHEKDGSTVTEEKVTKVDLSPNWDKFPKFGEYSAITKFEREENG